MTPRSLLVGCTLALCASTFGCSSNLIQVERERSASDILASYAAAWRGVREFDLRGDTTLGIWVDEVGYTIVLTNDGGALRADEPDSYDWGFETDLETLRRLDAGTLNALTAMGQARASDPIPMDVSMPDDFTADADVRSYYIPLTIHFWNREWPETIRFGEAYSRAIHGANATVLVYDEGLRTAWYQLKSGMHINSDPADQTNDFETAIIVTEGRFRGKIAGDEHIFVAGETVLIPAGTTHEFYASGDEYGEFIILMWDEGA